MNEIEIGLFENLKSQLEKYKEDLEILNEKIKELELEKIHLQQHINAKQDIIEGKDFYSLYTDMMYNWVLQKKENEKIKEELERYKTHVNELVRPVFENQSEKDNVLVSKKELMVILEWAMEFRCLEKTVRNALEEVSFALKNL